ncbi:MAG: CDP-glycerol glycerophosphotransferase family protein [Candidatus Andersenbacteria bacterium]|nr:CDP-glycerol glycerophosphotransferase family protein [Candidatus Andersenbacteria bacterium]
MRLLFSALTGYNFRELLLPLKPRLDSDDSITAVLVVTPGAAFSRQLFSAFGPKYSFVPVLPDEAAYRQYFAQSKPDVVVTPTAGLEPLDIPLIRAAQMDLIPTLTFVASWDNVYKMERRIKMSKYREQYAIADHFAVWNAENRDHLLAIIPHLPMSHVTITGPPRLDWLASADDLPNRRQLFAKLGLPDGAKKLIHIATTELYPSDYIIKTLASARGSDLGFDTVMFVSVHPGGQLDTHQRYSAPYGAYCAYSFGRRESSPVEQFKYCPTLEDIRWHSALFKRSHLLINHSSTVTIESLVANRPVINVKYGRPFDWWRWYRSMIYRDFRQHAKVFLDSAATRIVQSPQELIQAARAYLHHPAQDRAARQQLAQKMITFTDGRCGQRLLDLIKNVASVKQSL